MKFPKIKYNAAEVAALAVLFVVTAILATVLLGRSCKSGKQTDDIMLRENADSIVSVLDRNTNPPVKAKKVKRKIKKTNLPDTMRRPISRDYLNEPVNE